MKFPFITVKCINRQQTEHHCLINPENIDFIKPISKKKLLIVFRSGESVTAIDKDKFLNDLFDFYGVKDND